MERWLKEIGALPVDKVIGSGILKSDNQCDLAA